MEVITNHIKSPKATNQSSNIAIYYFITTQLCHFRFKGIFARIVHRTTNEAISCDSIFTFFQWICNEPYKLKYQFVISIYIIVAVFFLPVQIKAQSNCENIGFETGTTDFFQLNKAGVSGGMIFGIIPDFNGEQYKIESVQDGYDRIAFNYCIENKFLKKVGFGMGRFGIQLGDSVLVGAKASQLTRTIHVTPDNNFLVLNYALVLEDPAHDSINQPFFELTFRDGNDEIFPCGRYYVVSKKDIEGFENCRDWRVKPWTAAGFELQSHIGDVTINITVADCALGGHAAYAYVNLECRPLKIVLDGYCPESLEATMTVTEGFEKYEWNTGDTTNQIKIRNPTPGNIYSVQVTSSTGCVITLSDTLPSFETIKVPKLDKIKDTTICDNQAFFFWPSGENIKRIEWVGYGEIFDSLYINPATTTEYQIVAKDENGCESDTISFTVHVNISTYNYEIDIQGSSPCDTTIKGGAIIKTNAIDSVLISIDGENYDLNNVFYGLSPGKYDVFMKAKNGCVTKDEFIIPQHIPIKLPSIYISDKICDKNGTIYIAGPSFGGNSLFLNDSLVTPYNYIPVDSGNYTLLLIDSLNCRDSVNVLIKYIPLPTIEKIDITTQDCFQTTDVKVFGTGVNPFLYSIDYGSFQSNTVFKNVTTGLHTFIICDINNCYDTISMNIKNSYGEPEIDVLNIVNPKCSKANGMISLNVNGGLPDYLYQLNNGSFSSDTFQFNNLTSGEFTIIVKDKNNCKDTAMFNLILESTAPNLNIINIVQPHCNEINGSLSLTALSGLPPYKYSSNGVQYNNQTDYLNLESGEYTYYILDSLGCADTIQLQLERIDTMSYSSVRIGNTYCNQDNGQIYFNFHGGKAPYQYFLNGSPISIASGWIDSLSVGQYSLTLKDSLNCESSLNFYIDSFALPKLSLISFEDEHCNKMNGIIKLSTDKIIEPFEIILNNNIIGEVQEILHLPGGDYHIVILDSLGCADSMDIYLSNTPFPIVSLTGKILPSCEHYNGGLFSSVSSGSPPFSYYFNDQYVPNIDTIKYLNSGIYELKVIDQFNCVDSTSVELKGLSIKIEDLSISDGPCPNIIAELSMDNEIGCPPYTLNTTNNEVLNFDRNITLNTTSPRFEILIKDDCGCTLDTTVFFNFPANSFFIPNVFSPNGDGYNDNFVISGIDNREFIIKKFLIFDRWGGVVFSAFDFPINSNKDKFWDGKIEGNWAIPGVYVYLILLEDECGIQEQKSGDVLLMK